jgi:hypothetical protein
VCIYMCVCTLKCIALNERKYICDMAEAKQKVNGSKLVKRLKITSNKPNFFFQVGFAANNNNKV